MRVRFAIALLSAAIPLSAFALEGKVIGIQDGDTVTVLLQGCPLQQSRQIDADKGRDTGPLRRERLPLASTAMEADSLASRSPSDCTRNKQERIRISGIDAPEKKQAYGTRARQAMAELCFQETADIDGSKRDRYGRLLAKIRCRGKDAGLELVKSGMAWHYKKYEREQEASDRKSYADSENEARAAGRGLWADRDPVAPWDWRKARK